MAFVYTGEGVTETPVYKIPPEGDYVCSVVSCEETVSKSGANMFKFRLKIQHPEYKNELFYFIVQNQYAQQNIFDVMTSCGRALSPGLAITAESFVGNVGKVRLKHDVYNGETQLRVTKWLRPSPAQNSTPASGGIVDPAYGPARDPNQIPF